MKEKNKGETGRDIIGLVKSRLVEFFDLKTIWFMAGLLFLASILWFWLGSFGFIPTGDFPVVPGSKWQAVVLANNQIYFGHLRDYNRKFARLKSVYYLRTNPPAKGQEGIPNFNLVRLGSEPHGPEEVMYIPKDKILLWENLRSDSEVVKAMAAAGF